MKDRLAQANSSSLVIEYEIFADKEILFEQWQAELKLAASKFKGYLGTDIFPPIIGGHHKWYIVVRFDNSANLTCWFDSDIRHELIRTGRKNFAPYEYKNLGTGLEEWFSQKRNVSSKPKPILPAWKQNFAVLFGLYPVVMIENLLFSHFGLMTYWPLAHKIFVGNVISCSLLTWVVMPLVTKLLKFWLKPQRSLLQINLAGTVIVFLGYGLMISLFNFLS
jgi:uncharacterized protein